MTERLAINESLRVSEKQLSPALKTAIQLGQLSYHLTLIERVPRFADGKRENVAVHSANVASLALALNRQFDYGLDDGEIASAALIHDYPEIITGDTPTFSCTKEELDLKKTKDLKATEELSRHLPLEVAIKLRIVERGYLAEHRLMSAADKLAPLITDIIGQGKEVMRKDYEVETLADFQEAHDALIARYYERFGDEFPELCTLYEEAVKKFEQIFITGVPIEDEYERFN